MKNLSRCVVWAVLAVGCAFSAPMDQQKIYFPGENPEGVVESRSYGLQPNVKLPSDYHILEEGHGRDAGWSEGNMHHREEPQQYHLEHPQISPYGGHSNVRGEYHTGEWGQDSLSAGSAAHSNYNGISQTAHYQNLAGAHENANYLQELPNMYSSSNGAVGEQKIRKHWSSQYSGETGRLQNEPHHIVHTIQTSGDTGLNVVQGPNFSSSGYHTRPEDLTSILDGQSDHKLHPNIKEALDNVIKDFGDASGKLPQTSHHRVHKISHIKKTTVQNVGRDPNPIQTTSSNDDINLSQLIEQLQMLEQSPRHMNITWCEEKIKEFLRELRRKQASGVYINQQVQEQTLHQILTHETSVENESGTGVYEPPMTKVTVHPLGGEDQSREEFNTNEQSHVQKVSIDQTQDGSSDQVEQMHESHVPEILTAIPPALPTRPEIMSHQYEQPKEAPPFISDNSSDLKELELELPEYVPFEHSHSGVIDAFEGSTHKETRPMPHSTTDVQSQSEISTAHKSEENIPQTNPEVGGAAHHGVLVDQQINEQSSSNDIPGDHDGISTSEDEHIHPGPGVIGQSSREELMKGVEESNHTVHGRPQAPEEQLTSSHGEIREHSKESEQLVDTGEVPRNENSHETSLHVTEEDHHFNSHESTSTHIENIHHQQVNYDNLIEELIQLESIPGHQAIDKCEEKIQEFLEILKYQQEQGFGRNQQELEKLHATLIEQAKERSKQLSNNETTSSPISFWRKVQKKIKNTYQSATDRAKEALG